MKKDIFLVHLLTVHEKKMHTALSFPEMLAGLCSVYAFNYAFVCSFRTVNS